MTECVKSDASFNRKSEIHSLIDRKRMIINILRDYEDACEYRE